ncbi:MAG: threonine ammonia-lyase [Desulfurococcaceae archaeon]
MLLNPIIEKAWSTILDASSILYKAVIRTPLIHNAFISKITRNYVYLKLENLQVTGSFKVRGAYYKIYKNLEIARNKGVVTASSGNHAQGVAYAASILGVDATVVMPETAPPFKINSTKSYGAKVILHGSIYDDAYRKAMEIVNETGAIFIHPFNDIDIIAGQGTIGLEIIEQLSNVDAVIVPIGGGGLISGVGVALKKLKPGVKVIGVEPSNAAKYFASRKAGVMSTIEPKISIADGVVTKSVGDLTYEIMNEVVDDVITVDEESIARAIYVLMERAKIIVEGAGALPAAALLDGNLNYQNKTIALVISGGNIDLATLYKILIKGLAHDNRITNIRVVLRDVHGQLLKVLKVLHKYRCNIIDIRHDRFNLKVPVGHALVEIFIEIPDVDVVDKIRNELVDLGVTIWEK